MNTIKLYFHEWRSRYSHGNAFSLSDDSQNVCESDDFQKKCDPLLMFAQNINCWHTIYTTKKVLHHHILPLLKLRFFLSIRNLFFEFDTAVEGSSLCLTQQ